MAAVRGAIDTNELFNRAINIQINATIKEFGSSTQENLISDRPDVNVTEITEEKLVFTAAFDSMPTVKLADYKNFDLKLDSTEVTADEINHEFNRMIKKDTMLVPKETGPVQKGDLLNIDFYGYKDGLAFPGGSAKNQELEIGSNSFIPGFEEALIGMNIGETKSIDLSFPKDYHVEDLAGKEVKFDVIVNSINSVEQPEFNEQYFSKFKLENVKTEHEFKEYLKKQLVD
jgi:trigger factor